MAVSHLVLVLLLLWADVTVSMDLQKRIIGGRDCGPNDRLYHVKLNFTNGTHEALCGGSLISNQWILTAAHCWIDGWSIHLPQSHQSTITEHKIYKNRSSIGQEDHDIMLLKLSQTVTNITPVNLPNYGPASQTLQCAEMDVVDCSTYKNSLKNSNNPDTIELYKNMKYQHWFCGAATGVDTCPGDSGGGVVANNMIYGVISFGNQRVCRRPAAFMDLCHPDYEKWITDNISSE
ncbi:trypsin-like [Anabas testudineus]|uniref:trypsin-like n=1 Tax=Anabas testudineus TaxID=64144 RepID=UPI000E46523D|nr:trypsin-like [Anabas testudineus]